jgi:hypothetical protein
LGWVAVNTVGHVKRAVVLATIGSFSGLGSIVGSFAFVSTDGPRYLNGYIISISFLCTGFILTCVYVLGLRWENIARESGKREHLRAVSEDEELADHHVVNPLQNCMLNDSLISDIHIKQ